MSSLPPVFVELRANIDQFQKSMGTATKEIDGLNKNGSSSFNKLAAVGKVALIGLGTSALAVGAYSIKMADEFDTSHNKLVVAMKNSGAQFNNFAPQIDKVQKSMEQYGYTNAQVQEALANLTTGLKSPQKAINDIGLAADLAAYKHIDLATAATMVTKAAEGQTTALKKIGIDLPVVAGGAKALMTAQQNLTNEQEKATTYLKGHTDALNAGSKAHLVYAQMLDKIKVDQQKVTDVSNAGTTVLKGLAAAIHGQAAAAADTLAGRMKALHAEGSDLAKNFGEVLMPVITKLIGVVVGIVSWFTKHKAAAIALGSVIVGVLSVAIGAYIATLVRASVVQIQAFVADIAKGAAWVADKVLQYTAVSMVAISSAAESAAAWVAANASMILATGGIVLAIGLLVAAGVYIATHWKKIWSDIKQWVSDAWDGIKAIGSGIASFFKGIFDDVGSIIKDYINFWIGLIDKVIGFINDIPHVHIPGTSISIGIPHIPDIPKLANGGIVSKPTIAMIGEAGAEAVVPLSKGKGMLGGGMNVTVNVQGSIIAQNDLINTVRDGLAQALRRKGAPLSSLGL